MNDEDNIAPNCTYQKLYLMEVDVEYKENNIIKNEIVYAFNDVIVGEFNAWIEFDCIDEDDILGKYLGAAILISTTQGSKNKCRWNLL